MVNSWSHRWRKILQQELGDERPLYSRRAFWGGALLLVLIEVLASWTRSQVLPHTLFFRLPFLWLGLAVCKGLFFGPVLGVLTLRIFGFWRRKHWDEACYLCLRGGAFLSLTQGSLALGSFLLHSHFPLLTWMVASWSGFALWLTLNGALLWAILLLVAGFLLPSDPGKAVQISDSLSL